MPSFASEQKQAIPRSSMVFCWSCRILWHFGVNNKCSLSFKDTPESGRKRKSLEERRSGKGQWKCGETQGCVWLWVCRCCHLTSGGEGEVEGQVTWNSRERKYMSYNAKLSPLKLMGPILTSTWSMGIPLLTAWLLCCYWWLVYPPWAFMMHSWVI